jgi:hypothetical protein
MATVSGMDGLSPNGDFPVKLVQSFIGELWLVENKSPDQIGVAMNAHRALRGVAGETAPNDCDAYVTQ